MKNLVKLLVAIGFVFSFTAKPALGKGPVIVGGGAGGSEFSVAFTRVNLVSLLSTCKNFECQLKDSEKASLNELVKLAANPPVALFKTNSETSGRLFIVHQNTHDVWFNQEHLWLDDSGTKPYSVADAVNLWVDVLANENIPFLDKDLNAVKAATYERLSQNFESIPGDLGAVVWQQAPADRLYLLDCSGQTLDVHQEVESLFKCTGSDSVSLQIFSGTWQNIESNSTSQKYVLKLRVNWSCDPRESNRGEVAISMWASSPQLQIDPATLSFILGE